MDSYLKSGLISRSKSSTNKDGLIFKAEDNLKRVVIVGCLSPLSSNEIYVRSRSQNSASFSCEILFFTRNSLKTMPNVFTIIMMTLVSIKIE